MRYALIGCGNISKNHIASALENHLQIVAVCDILPEQMEAVLEKNGISDDNSIKRYTDYKKMIEENDLDLISIATSSGAHAEIVLYCIDHGIHVIVEKPMAMNMKDADEIVRRSEEKGVKVSACHQNRFNLAIQKVKGALDAGKFGMMSHGSINVRWNRNKAYYKQAAWRGTWAEDGGALMNQCIHGIDLLRWLMGGDVEEVFGATRQRFHDYLEAEDIGVAVVKFKNGAVATIEGTTNIYPRNLEETLCLFGSKGTVKVGGMSANDIVTWDFEDEKDEANPAEMLHEATVNVYGNGHARLFADVIDAIQNDRKPYVDAVAGRNALEMVLAIYKSQLTGQAVKLPLDDFSTLDMVNIFDK
ncbi:MAG: Gfo/Idh/MocA family oxidoreductase [Eubacteriales bacterium]|nr:Gfo/Idh/MocA family oxidoreductase [Eubacteriales bacterium]